MRVLTEQVTIAASHDEVWAVLEDFGGVAKWAPYMKRSKLVGNQASGVGTRRIMHHDLGFNFEEAVTEWKNGQGYSFDVYRAPYPMKDVHENWNLVHHDGVSTVSTQVNYRMKLGAMGKLLDQLLVRFIVRREMRAGLRGLKDYVANASQQNPDRLYAEEQ